MSEIYKSSTQFVYLDLIGETADALPTATVTNGGVVSSLSVNTDTPPSGVTERYYVVLGLANTQAEGDLTVDWALHIGGTPVTKEDVFSVVTPYLSIAEVKAIWPQKTDDEAIQLETVVRHIIEAHTGQYFGLASKSLTIRGAGEAFLRLPERLVELDGITTLTTTLNIADSIITGDGWYLKKGWTQGSVYTPSDNLYFGNIDEIWHLNPEPDMPGYEKPDHGPVIMAPGLVTLATCWSVDYPFVITGKWGYKNLPTDVVLAAKMLVNDYGCNEIMYRDKMLKAIKFADADIDFSMSSWTGTGNLRADQLLSRYVMLDWALL